MYWGNLSCIVFGGVYVVALLYANKLGLSDPTDALTLFAIFGVAFPGVAVLLAWGHGPAALTLTEPAEEAALALVIAAAISVYLVDAKPWIDSLVSSQASPLCHEAVRLGGKLMVFVAVPFLLFRAIFGSGWAQFGLSVATIRRLLGRDGIILILLGGAFLAFQYFVGNAAVPIREGKLAGTPLYLSLGLGFVWLAIEAGLVEEFLFRSILQERIGQALGSPLAGLLFASLVFGLGHAPGIAFRDAGDFEGFTGHPGLLGAAAYTVIVQSVGGLTFGVVWMLTRSLPLVVLLHAILDILPFAPEFAKISGLT